MEVSILVLEGFTFKSETLPEDPLKGMEARRDYLGKVVACGFVDPPQWWKDDQTYYATKFGRSLRTPESLFVLAIEPLGWAYDTDKVSFLWNRLQNCEFIYWLDFKDEAGKPKYRQGVFADIRNAFAKLGYVINTSADCQKLVGHQFQFAVVERNYAPNQSKPTELHIPIEERADYTFAGVKRILKRPKPKDEAPVEQADPAEEESAMEVLSAALNGVSADNFFSAVSKLALPASIKSNILAEAVNDDGAKLISRMVGSGRMTYNSDEGTLVEV